MEIYEVLKYSPGSCDEIYAAMDTNDTLTIARAARNTTRRYYILEKIWSSVKQVHKLGTLSNNARKCGNAFYKEGNYRKAIQFYNQALLLAPKNSDEQMLAYGNRSAVLFSIRHFFACVADIRTCLSMGCPRELSKRLNKRLEDTQEVVFEELMLELAHEQNNQLFLSIFETFKCHTKKHADVPCAIADVTFMQKGVKGITAKKDIKVGSVVAMEKAFVTCQQPKANFTSCYYCNKMALDLHPCQGCTQALFCSGDCRDLCTKEYHSIECQIVDFLLVLYDSPVIKLATRSAIKMSLKMGWDAFVEASQNIGASRMKTATVRETYNSEEPLSIFCYDDAKVLTEGKMFNGSIYCAAIMARLEMLPNYFPNVFTKRKAASDAMSRVILHLYATFSNAIPITCSTWDYNSKKYMSNAQTNYGWFSMCSKLKHSCEPNLYVVGLNDTVALIALNTIKKGEHLTISYIENFCDVAIPEKENHPLFRCTRIFIESRHMCDCRVCLQELDATNEVYVKMTSHEETVYSRLQMNLGDYDAIRQTLDTFSWGTTQHKTAYTSLKQAINVFQCSKYTNNRSYLDVKPVTSK